MHMRELGVAHRHKMGDVQKSRVNCMVMQATDGQTYGGLVSSASEPVPPLRTIRHVKALDSFSVRAVAESPYSNLRARRNDSPCLVW